MTDQTATEATDLEARLREALAGDPVAVENALEAIRPTLAERDALRAEVQAARKYAAELREYCSPHGVSVHYADRLVEVMDQAKEAGR